ncbi:Fur family ferric uptake transcriptional regulator [Pseudonocardia kunmingensis]|uniref:Fur family ferric uptake transcriptional regulator n=1 Tax=Pseudonocardia kunmingensis TaxID=630975 RepID=A0A543D9V5_9PSEU|nr:Fur family ferric uptake transcriptional regulator [Pseudonocardia kunmingensis]
MNAPVTRMLRTTRQRAAVSALLGRLAEFRSAQDIHEELQRAGDGIGLTTVYRTLQILAESGAVDVLRTGTGEAMYRRCATAEHHHHLVCRRCGATVEIEGPAVETWATTVAEAHGFTELSHTADIFGLCRECTTLAEVRSSQASPEGSLSVSSPVAAARGHQEEDRPGTAPVTT